MISAPRSLLVVLASCASLGCTSMRSVTSNERDAVIAALEPGNRVSVLTPGGWHDDVKVVTVSGTTLELATWDNEPVTVARADVWELRVPLPSKGKTAALVGAIVGAVALGTLINDTGAELEF
jgi:preprotein translocase subunit YajC